MKKKLKAKRFRYLPKYYIKDPDRFLKEIVVQWGINWSENFNYFVNSSICPQMRHGQDFEYGFIHLHMGQMIETAYIILKKNKLKSTDKGEVFRYSSKEIVTVIMEKEMVLPEKSLCDFFGFKKRKEWYNVLDDLLVFRDIADPKEQDIHLDTEYMAIRELLVMLPRVLLEIHNRGRSQDLLIK